MQEFDKHIIQKRHLHILKISVLCFHIIEPNTVKWRHAVEMCLRQALAERSDLIYSHETAVEINIHRHSVMRNRRKQKTGNVSATLHEIMNSNRYCGALQFQNWCKPLEAKSTDWRSFVLCDNISFVHFDPRWHESFNDPYNGSVPSHAIQVRFSIQPALAVPNIINLLKYISASYMRKKSRNKWLYVLDGSLSCPTVSALATVALWCMEERSVT